MSTNQKQDLINEMLEQVSRREQEFPTIDKDGRIRLPISYQNSALDALADLEGQVQWNTILLDSNTSLKGYKGLALEVNDHGNVTVWKCFKNGNRREIASRV